MDEQDEGSNDEIRFEPYRRRNPVADDFSWWVDPYPNNYHVEVRHPIRPLTDNEYQSILSVLSGETKEEWAAHRAAEGKPISPIGEEKQD